MTKTIFIKTISAFSYTVVENIILYKYNLTLIYLSFSIKEKCISKSFVTLNLFLPIYYGRRRLYLNIFLYLPE